MQQFLAQFSYSAFSTREWMHRSLIVLFYQNYHIDTILYIKICYIERKYIHVYIVVGVPARVCIYVFKNMRQYIISRTLPNLSYCWIRPPTASELCRVKRKLYYTKPSSQSPFLFHPFLARVNIKFSYTFAIIK